MPVNVDQIIAAGFEELLIGINDSDGYPIALTGTLAPGASAGLSRFVGVQTANVNIPQANRVPVRGNNRVSGVFIFDPGETPTFEIEVGTLDLNLGAAIEGGKVRDVGDFSVRPIFTDTKQFKSCTLWFLSHATSQEDASDGLAVVYGLMVPRATLNYLGPTSIADVSERSWRYEVVVNPTSKYPWGELLTLENDGCTRASLFETTSEYWPDIVVAYGDDALTSVTLPYEPAGDETTNKTQAWIDGTTKALDSVDTATKLVSWTTALAAGEKMALLYEHEQSGAAA